MLYCKCDLCGREIEKADENRIIKLSYDRIYLSAYKIKLESEILHPIEYGIFPFHACPNCAQKFFKLICEIMEAHFPGRSSEMWPPYHFPNYDYAEH